MHDLIREAIEFIHHNPEKAKFINYIIEWDDETRSAFKLAYSLYKDREKER
jgi:hypothetical protein